MSKKDITHVVNERDEQIEKLRCELRRVQAVLTDQTKRADAIDLDNSRLNKQLQEERKRVYALEKERDEVAGRIRAVASLMMSLAPPPAPFTDRFPRFQVG